MTMNSRLYDIFTRCILIWIMVLVCLPCTARRAFKQALDIPVAVVAPGAKANQTQHCSVINDNDVTGKQSINGKQKLLLQKSGSVINLGIPVLLVPYFTSFTQLSAAVAVPLYILHRQYLI